MEQIIDFKNMPIEENINIRAYVVELNYLALDWCNTVLYPQGQQWDLRDYTYFFTKLNTLFHMDENCQEELADLQKMSDMLLDDTTKLNDQALLTGIAYEIGTNSEIDKNYTVFEQAVMIMAAAKRLGIKFDF